MAQPLQRDWEFYEQKRRKADAQSLRNLTIDEGLALYEDMYRLAMSQKDDSPGLKRLEKKMGRESRRPPENADRLSSFGPH